jgi:tetratricopeptide (TPR) repeat protein
MLKKITIIFFLSLCFLSSVIAQEDPIAIFNQGQDAQEKGNFEAAIKFYDQALQIIPDFPEAENQKATAYLSLKNFDSAEKSFRKALELREDWTLPMVNLGSLLVRKNKFEEAEKLLAKAISIDEFNIFAYIGLTELRLKTNASVSILKELLAKLTTISAKQRPGASIWASRGSIERKLGDLAAAKISQRKALEIDALNQFALAEIIELSLAESDFPRAIEDAKLLTATAPTPQNKYLLARTYAESGKTGEALKILDTLNQADSDVSSLKTAINSATSTDIIGLEKSLEQDSRNVALLGRLCKLTRTSDALKAIDFCRRALEIEPTNINHAVGFASALVRAKQFDNAIAVSRKIIQISPDSYTAHANLALSFFQLKRFEEAKVEYRWLADAKPEIPATYFFLAISHDNLQEYTDAMANYQKFLGIVDPKQNQLEIDKVNLRLPILQKQIKSGAGRKKK